MDYEKYANNYDYNKAVFLMSNFKILDNGFLILKEDEGFSSPISTLFYGYYSSIDELTLLIEENKNQLQCVVSHAKIAGALPFGQTQSPQLWDYADGVNTLDFLRKLS